MAKRKKTVRIDSAAPYNPDLPCPACNGAVHMYVPPERDMGGPKAYPALLLHYEATHPNAVPPPPPQNEVLDDKGKPTGEFVVDEWETSPPDPDNWIPVDLERAKRQLRQEDGVWPPVRMPEMPI